ncbi:MAG: cupin domain-containing protein [Parachlamydiales bacterium]|jgi:mannose-6-phosphate isomerase-like protein (cupin superfamily)
MNIQRIIDDLKIKYPSRNIIKNDESNSTEILCEIDPSKDHPDYSNAVAIIDKSKPHVHRKTTETYKIIKGKLILHIGDQSKELNEGDTYTIEPGNVHWAEGNETWVECYSEPGWTFEDHILQ